MRGRTALGLVTGLLAVALATAAPAGAGAPGETTIRMSTHQETSDVFGKGKGSFTWSIDGNQLCYTLSVSNLTMAPFAAHIHPGARKVNGPAAVGLVTPPAATSTVSACITAVEGATGQGLSTAELAAIDAEPKGFYVNVHTNNWPAGEVRGQLR